MPPPVCIKFYIQPPLSLVAIFPYAPPWFPNPRLQVIIAQSLTPSSTPGAINWDELFIWSVLEHF